MKRIQLVLSAMLFASVAVLQAQASSDCSCDLTGPFVRSENGDLPSPFTPTCIHREDWEAHWRHGFHKVRTTWDKYFEVAPDREKLVGFEAAEFEKIRATPGFFVDRKVQFDIYMGKIGQFYRPFLSPFSSDGHVNFSGWAYGAPLWTKEGRGEIHPLFYIDKRNKKIIDVVQHLPMFTPIHVWGEVSSKSDNTPWIDIVRVKIIPEVVLTESAISHIELGANQFAKKRYDLAAQSLEQSLALQLPASVEARVYDLLGKTYLEARLYRKARNAYVNSLLRDDGNVSNLIGLAHANLNVAEQSGFAIKDGALVEPAPNQTLVAEAKEATDRAIALDPANPEAHAWQGLALAMGGSVRDGYKEIDFAQKLSPRNTLPLANRNRARIAFAEGKLGLAKDELNQAVIYRPTDVDLKLELGDVYVALNDIPNARLEFNQARELSPDRVEPWYKIALLLKLQGDAARKEGKQDVADKFYSEALENVKTALTKNDRYAPALTLQADIIKAMQKADLQDSQYEKAAAAGDWPGMEAAARAALEIVQDPLHYSRLGSVLASKPNPDLGGAVTAYVEATKLDPKSEENWAAIGNIRARFLNQWTEAQQALDQAVKLKPADAFAWQDMAYARRNAGDKEGAIKAADEAVKSGNSVESRLMAAQTRLDHNTPDDVSAAIELAKSVLADAKVDRDVAMAHSIFGGALLQLQKPDAALEHLAAADSLLKANAEQSLWYGIALSKTGNMAGAQEHLNSAIELSKANAGQSQVSARIMAQAEEALKNVKTLAKEGTAPESLPRTETIRIPQPSDVRTANGVKPRKNTAPVIEEPDTQQPVPAQVPGLR